jgi:Protein of unknown function (DUF2934)
MAKKQTIASEIGSALGAVAARAEQIIASKPATKPTAKRTTAAKHSSASKSSLAQEVPIAIAVIPETVIEIDREEIAKQAYLYWEQRGYQGGNPDEDWVRAEEELKQRTLSASA